MTRRVFFSFAYEDVSRAMVVRNSGAIQGAEAAGFIDAAEFRKIESGGDLAIQKWIDDQLNGTSVTVVLVAATTCNSRWVKYEIDRSVARGNGLLGIDVSGIKDFNGQTTYCCGQLPRGYTFFNWNHNAGYQNLGGWMSLSGFLCVRHNMVTKGSRYAEDEEERAGNADAGCQAGVA